LKRTSVGEKQYFKLFYLVISKSVVSSTYREGVQEGIVEYHVEIEVEIN